MKRVTESGWGVIAVMHNGHEMFMRPLKRSRQDARKWIDTVGIYEASKLGVAKFRVAPVRVTELTPKLKKKIKISLARGARQAK